MTGYYQQSYDYEMPSFTFISSPEQMKKPVSSSDLGSAYLFLKHQPECACGKEFRASGKDTALQNVAKHLLPSVKFRSLQMYSFLCEIVADVLEKGKILE